jgi:hypothetical protein
MPGTTYSRIIQGTFSEHVQGTCLGNMQGPDSRNIFTEHSGTSIFRHKHIQAPSIHPVDWGTRKKRYDLKIS